MNTKNITIRKTCIECGKYVPVVVDVDKYKSWATGGMFIQHAFPELTKDQREMLISGICGSCFDLLFAERRDLNV